MSVREDARPGSVVGEFTITSNPDQYRGVACDLHQLQPPPQPANTSLFSVR